MLYYLFPLLLVPFFNTISLRDAGELIIGDAGKLITTFLLDISSMPSCNASINVKKNSATSTDGCLWSSPTLVCEVPSESLFARFDKQN
jgi:hypothetical protein